MTEKPATSDFATAETRPAPDFAAAEVIWTDLKNHLAERFRQLSDELRHYPTPIARCDDQLPGLIEHRDHARRELERMSAIEAGSAASPALLFREIERFVERATAAGDDTERELRVRLLAALAAKVPTPARDGSTQ